MKRSKFIVVVTALLLVLVAGAITVYAANQMKSTDVLAYSSDVAVSSTVNAPFTIYLGDTIGALAVKSFSVAIGGVYTSTAAGTLTVTLDGDAATAQAFDLPHVNTTPTPFQITYRDPSGKVNPSSAGSYSYTLNMTPANVTIYNLSAVASETHRYTPPTCADGSTQKVKTNEFLVVSSDTAVSVPRTDSFSLYLGDNMADITTPLKSLQFTVSGVYTGGGTVIMSLNSDTATALTFTLPAVGTTPTHFEFIYKDPTDSISPTSAGSYTYTITTNPSSVVLYQLGITARETHRYVPPTCGGMSIKGELYSAVFETTATTTGGSYNSIMWKGSLGTGGTGKVNFQLAASDCANGATNAPDCTVGSWAFVGGATCSSAAWFGVTTPINPDTPYDLQSSSCTASWNNKRYYRYAVQICSNDCSVAGTYTPQVDDVIVNWSP